MEKKDSVIRLLKREREFYEEKQKQHYIKFASLIVLLMVDFLVIIYIKAITLDAYAWTGIFLLFLFAALEAKHYLEYKELKENVDTFYLKNEIKK